MGRAKRWLRQKRQSLEAAQHRSNQISGQFKGADEATRKQLRTEVAGLKQTMATLKEAGIKVYFAHPASPRRRGTNENANGLIRQYFPKGTDFRTVPTRELKRAQRQLNDRPRQILDYLKPDEVFNRLVALNV